MTTMEKLGAQVNTLVNQVMDKEPVNYLEAAALFNIVGNGRQNIASLEVFYNHAQDPDLKAMIKRAIDHETAWLVDKAETFLQDSGNRLSPPHLAHRKLHDKRVEIPDDLRFSDMEIAGVLATIAKASQLAVLSAMHQTYQPEIQAAYRHSLDAGLDYDYELMQLLLRKGWLPHLQKIHH